MWHKPFAKPQYERGWRESMREIHVEQITGAIADACIEINYRLSPDVEQALDAARLHENGEIGRAVFDQLIENLSVARNEQIPICQDTGMVTVFLEIGQEVHFVGGALEEAVQAGVRRGYQDGYLRKSVVSDPLIRENTGDNTPAVIHTAIVPGQGVNITVTAKGFGSENTGRIFMLKPADGVEGVKNAVVRAVTEAGANACPPMVVGVGVGGNFEKCAWLAKHALMRPTGESSALPHIASLEREILTEINASGIGPAGLGGNVTALAVQIETYPTHIAGLPVAVNICCHVNRHKTVVL